MHNSIHITDWDDAYANRDHIPDAQDYMDKWEVEAPEFRQSMNPGKLQLDLPYGDGARERFDLFHPAGQPKGLFVFVHGGYWMAFDKNSWSQMAGVALNAGWAVAVPSYTLCPEVRIGDITQQIGAAIGAAAKLVEGKIVLSGHSAGGHLVSRMGCENTPLDEDVAGRIKHIISISGVHDLRPLRRLALNDTLNIDAEEANRESPALLAPRQGLVIDCVVGGDERPEFIRQNALLANVWIGLGARTKEIVVPGKHHFNVIEELASGEQGWLMGALS